MTTAPLSPISRRRFPLLLFGVLLLLDVAVSLAQKAAGLHGVGGGWRFYWSMAHTPWFWIGIALPPMQLLLYTRILARVDLSVAYPLTSLSVPLIMLAATLVFKEPLGWKIWAGGLLITLGVALLGSGEHSTDLSEPPLV